MKKKLLLIFIMLCSMLLISCSGKATIEGEWVLSEERCADGTVIKGDDLKVYECYVVTGEKASYTCDPEGRKSIELEMDVKQISDDEYEFWAAGKILFATAKLEGKKFSYTIGESDDATVFIFKKK